MNRSAAFVGKTQKVFVLGSRGCGKSSIIYQLIYGGHTGFTLPQSLGHTIDDTFIGYVDNERGGRERITFFDTCGLQSADETAHLEWRIAAADAIVLVFSACDVGSFALLEHLKRAVDRYREKKELPIICLANKCDRVYDRQLVERAQDWATREKLRLFEVSAHERHTLLEPFHHVSGRLNPPQNKSTFQQLSRKVKSANIPMEL